MTNVFGYEYANTYDLMYDEKDYEIECDAIERVIQRYSNHQPRTILDLGCGTGGHALRLTSRGYEVVGVDRSEHMLEIARSKALSEGLSVTFVAGDVTSIQLQATFDAVLFMFAVLGYQLENRDVVAALKNARRHLRSGALLVGDLWYGPAVLSQRPTARLRRIQSDKDTLLKCSNGEIDLARQVCRVVMNVIRIRDQQVLSEVEETHEVRFFFPQELELLLTAAGFELIRVSAFPELEIAADESTWNAMIVAKAS